MNYPFKLNMISIVFSLFFWRCDFNLCFQNAWHTAGRWCLGQGVQLVLWKLGSINHPSVSVKVGCNCSWMQPHASRESSLSAAYVCTLLPPLPAGLLTSGDPLWVWWITGMTHSFLDWVRLAGQGRKHNTAYLRNERWCHLKKWIRPIWWIGFVVQ